MILLESREGPHFIPGLPHAGTQVAVGRATQHTGTPSRHHARPKKQKHPMRRCPSTPTRRLRLPLRSAQTAQTRLRVLRVSSKHSKGQDLVLFEPQNRARLLAPPSGQALASKTAIVRPLECTISPGEVRPSI